MKDIKLFCFGFGQVAKNFVDKVKFANYNIDLSSTSRSKTTNENFKGVNYKNFQFNSKKYDKDLITKLREADHILISIPPIEGGDLVVKNFSKYIEASKVKWITYLSATSVYGDHNGGWVNENSETKPASPKGIARLKAENSWLSLKTNKILPIQVFRLSGIYSNEKNILVRLKLGTAKLINQKNRFYSRIHVEDVANLLFKSLSKFKTGETYNLADDKPSSSKEIILYGAKILNIKNLRNLEIDEVESKKLTNFYKDSKKVDNKKVKKYFSYNFKFPTYIEGLNYIKDNFI